MRGVRPGGPTGGGWLARTGGNSPLTHAEAKPIRQRFSPNPEARLRDDYLKEAQKIIPDGNILINVVSRRVKQLKRGHRPLVESLEKLDPEDLALRDF